MVEYEMTRTRHLVASKLSAQDAGIMLDAIASVGEPVPSFLWRPSLRDADDDMVLEVAVSGHADVIVTFNRRDFRPASTLFGIEVLLPGAAIERLEGIS
jgi:predicted nucleic acid-binding protein